MNISEFRQQYPEYNDIPDPDLVDKFHAKYYSDIPKDQFVDKFVGTAYPEATGTHSFTDKAKSVVSNAYDTVKSGIGSIADRVIPQAASQPEPQTVQSIAAVQPKTPGIADDLYDTWKTGYKELYGDNGPIEAGRGFVKGLASGATFDTIKSDTANEAEGIGKTVGQFVGTVAPVSAAFKVAGAMTGGLSAFKTLSPLAKGMIDTALSASIYKGAEGAAQGKDPIETVKEMPKEALTWLALYGGAYGLNKVAQEVLKGWEGAQRPVARDTLEEIAKRRGPKSYEYQEAFKKRGPGTGEGQQEIRQIEYEGTPIKEVVPPIEAKPVDLAKPSSVPQSISEPTIEPIKTGSAAIGQTDAFKITYPSGAIDIVGSQKMAEDIVTTWKEGKQISESPAESAQKVSEALDKPNQVNVLKDMNVPEEKMPEMVVKDGVGSYVRDAEALLNKGDIVSARASIDKAFENGNKAVVADGLLTENAIDPIMQKAIEVQKKIAEIEKQKGVDVSGQQREITSQTGQREAGLLSNQEVSPQEPPMAPSPAEAPSIVSGKLVVPRGTEAKPETKAEGIFAPSITGKEQWQMTQKEFIDDYSAGIPENAGPRQRAQALKDFKINHRMSVENAIKEGKITSHPDYPDLAPTASKSETPQSNITEKVKEEKQVDIKPSIQDSFDKGNTVTLHNLMNSDKRLISHKELRQLSEVKTKQISPADMMTKLKAEGFTIGKTKPVKTESVKTAHEGQGDILKAGGTSEDTITETAKRADDFIEELSPPVGMSIRATKINDTITFPQGDTIASVSPTVESRWQKAKGGQLPSFITRSKEATVRLFHEFTRSRPELSPRKDGKVIDILRRHDETPSYSKAVATDVLKGITGGFGPKKYDVFTRNIILPDLIKDIDKGLLAEDALPFGYKNRTEIDADYQKFKSIADANPDIAKAIEVRNKFMSALKKDLVDIGALHSEVLKDPAYFHHQVLEYMAVKRFAGLSSQDVREHTKGWQIKRKGSEKDFNTDYLESEFEVIAQGIAKLKTHKILNEIKAATNIKPRLVTEAKDQGVEWQTLIPEGYTIWQPKPGTNWFKTMSITEKVLDKVLSGEKMLEADDVKEILAMGGKKEQWVIPQNVAHTLDNYKDFRDEGILSRFSSNALSSWKQWVLLNPYRIIKYNINNLSGDLDIVIAYNPKILRFSKEAARNLWRYQKGAALTSEMRDMVERGVISSGLTIVEIPDIKAEGVFRILTGKEPNLIEKYWKSSKDMTVWRENILRYAAYKHFLSELQQGKKVYGASIMSVVDDISDIKDKAAMLARDLIGDYGNVSHAGQWIRRHMIPFYSWMEVNAPRYVRLFKNAKDEGKSGAEAAGIAGWRTGKKIAGLTIRASILYTSIQLWNHTFFADEEKQLTLEQRKQLHIILGRNDDGTIRSMRFQGALSDALSYFGLENAPEDIKNIKAEDKTLEDQGKEMLLATPQKIVSGLRPFEKSLYEVITGRSLYPDMTKPKPIRDKTEYLTKTVSADTLYRYLTGKPTRGITKDIANILIYTTDPGEGAYFTTRQMTIDFMKKLGRSFPVVDSTEKSNALYYYKQAMRFGDEAAQKKYLTEYFKLGGTKEGIARSIKMADPIAVIPKQYKGAFVSTLKPEERQIVRAAYRWYNTIYLGQNPQTP